MIVGHFAVSTHIPGLLMWVTVAKAKGVWGVPGGLTYANPGLLALTPPLSSVPSSASPNPLALFVCKITKSACKEVMKMWAKKSPLLCESSPSILRPCPP